MASLSTRVADVFEALGRWQVRRRGLALLLLALVTALAAVAGGLRVARDGMPLDFTPQAVFMDGGPEVLRVQQVAEVFGRDDNDLVLLVRGPLATPEGVATLRALHQTLAQHPRVERVESLVSATTLQSQGGALVVTAPLDELPPAEALAHAAADPVLSGLLVSVDGDTTAVRARLDRDLDRVADLSPVVWELVAAAQALDRPDGMRIVPTGVPYVRAEVVQLMWESQFTYLPIVAGLFAITICLLFRRVLLGLAPLVTVLIADVWAMGALIGGGQVLNILSILVPTLVLVIGVADGIHIAARYVEELEVDRDREAAMGRALRAMALPCFLTTFTTAAGFLSLLVADTAVMRGFGVQASVAMAVTFAAVILVLPTLLAWIPVRRLGSAGHSSGQVEQRLLDGLDRLVRRRPGLVLAGCAATVAVALAAGAGVRTNSRLLEMYSDGMDTWAAVHLAEAELSGVVPVYLYVEAPEADGLLDPTVLAAMGAVEARLQSHDAVLWTTSLSAQVRRLHGLLTDQPGLPETAAAVSQELLLAEMSGGELLEGLIDEDRRRGRVMVLMADAGGQVYIDLQADVQAFAAATLDPLGVDWALTGDGFLAASGVDRLIADLLSSLALVFAVIFVVFLLLLRDLKLALVALVPNFVPLVFTLATLGLMGADLQTSNIVSFTVAVGLAVDDTIHFIVRYRQERAAGRGTTEAMTATFRGAGHAILLTSLLLVIGFSVLATSVLTSTRHFGILAAVTMSAALMADLLLLPALLHRVDGQRSR